MRQVGAESLARKLYGRLSEQELSAMYDGLPETRVQGAVATDVESVQEALAKASHSELGRPVAVSVVWLGEDRWGILAMGASGQCVHRRVRISENLHDAKKQIENTPELYLGVPWTDGLIALAREVTAAATSADSSAQWIALAVEPTLAQLPWQALLTVVPAPQSLVTLVPSLTWTVLAQREQHRYDANSFAIVSSPEQLTARHRSTATSRALREISTVYDRLRAEVDRVRTAGTTTGASVAVVLGHGTWDSKTETTNVVAPETPIAWDKWLEIAGHRVVVIHACSAGRVAHQFLGDIGGLPSVALGQKCRIFAAPVAEVEPATATVFQMALTGDTHDSIGTRYLRAIRSDPNVALYNLWGFASEMLDA